MCRHSWTFFHVNDNQDLSLHRLCKCCLSTREMRVESKSEIKYKIYLSLHVLSCSMCSYRYIQMPRPFCFEPSNRYVVTIRFQRHGATHRHLTAFILIDSVS